MKFVVDEMPYSPEDCPFCNGITHSTCKLLHNGRCERFNPLWDYEPDCPFLISLKEIQKENDENDSG